MIDLTAIVAGLAGILLGGGITAAHAAWERHVEARSILSALVAEVDSVKRLIGHRGYIPQLVGLANHCRQLVENGNGHVTVDSIVIAVNENYFKVFDELSSKIGLLHPYHADRIVRFYTLSKAAKENFSPQSAWSQGNIQAITLLELLENDIDILRTVFLLGDKIATFINRKPPKGFVDEMINMADTAPDALALLIDARNQAVRQKTEQQP